MYPCGCEASIIYRSNYSDYSNYFDLDDGVEKDITDHKNPDNIATFICVKHDPFVFYWLGYTHSLPDIYQKLQHAWFDYRTKTLKVLFGHHETNDTNTLLLNRYLNIAWNMFNQEKGLKTLIYKCDPDGRIFEITSNVEYEDFSSNNKSKLLDIMAVFDN